MKSTIMDAPSRLRVFKQYFQELYGGAPNEAEVLLFNTLSRIEQNDWIADLHIELEQVEYGQEK
jgi:hypothetical protein